MRLFLISAMVWMAGCASTSAPTKPDSDPVFENQLAIKNLDNRFEQFKFSTQQRLDELEKKLGGYTAEDRRADIDSVVEEIGYLRTKLLIVEDDALRESNVVRHKEALKNMSESERRCWVEYDRLQWDIQHEEATGGIDREDMAKLREKAASCEKVL